MFTLNDILQSTEAQLHGNITPEPEMTFRAARHDSRQVEVGDLFVALKGVAADGHDFIAAAARAGALAALCARPAGNVPPGFLQIVVPDVLKALHATAHTRVQRQPETTLIGITGSNGKTSTKDAVAAVLSRKAPTLKTYASYNHEIGYPQTLLRLEPQHRYAVLEMGAQWVGELTWLCESVACPHWAMVTSVGAAHLALFGSQERVVLAKSELVKALAPAGIAFLNYDDSNVRGMAEQTRAHVVYYGRGEGAEVQAVDIGGDMLAGHSFTLCYHGVRQRVQLRLPGEHGVTIALAAAAVGFAAGMEIDEIAPVLESLAPARGRGEIKPGPNGSTLIDDTYNANRHSILTIVRAMRESTLATGKRWAVLGDIFELGSYAPAEHRAVGEALAGSVDYLVALGEQARFYVEGALAAGMPAQQAYYFSANVNNPAELTAAKRAVADLLLHEIRPGDLVLVKGSRGMYMETLLDLLHVPERKDNESGR